MSHNNHDIIRLRRGTAAEWMAANELLMLGEPGFEKDTNKLKIGDGVTLWNDLGYVTPDFINIVSSGGIADLTVGQQNDIVEGTIVLTSDGGRWIYSRSGSKTSEASYVQLADISPAWIQITSKPASLVGLADIASTSIGDFILATGNNTYQVTNFAESVDDRISQLLIAGSGISLNYNDSGNTLTFNVTDAPKILTNVFNKTGSPIPKFSVVYINGGQGDQPTIALAQANGELTSSKTYGVTAESIGNMSAGKIVVFGALTGVNTDQFNPTAPTGDVNGTILYLSPSTPGGVTTTKPSAPNHMVAIGTIVRTHQNQGVVEVRIQNGYELEELHNVAISGVTNGQFLQYNSGNQLWIPSSSGNFTALQVNGTGVSLTGHTHTANNITDFDSSVSGIIDTSLSTDVVAGAGISITYDNINDDLIIGSDGLVPVINLGAVTGVTAINAGINNSIQTLSLNGTSVNFTKGNNWPATSGVSTDTILKMTITAPTSITWTIVTQWFNQATSPVSSGIHLFLLRGIGTNTIEGHYIGNQT